MNGRGPLAWIRSSSARVPTYFAIIVAAIWLVNTPVPQAIIGALFGETVGIELGQSLQRSSRDLFLLLLIAIYLELAKGRQQHEIYHRIERRFDELLDQSTNQSPADVRRTIIESADSQELARAALRRGLQIEAPSNQLVNLIVPNRPVFRDVSITMTLESLPSSLVKLRTDMHLTANLRNLLIGATKNAAHSAIVSYECAELFEVLTLPSPADIQQPAAAVSSLLNIYTLGENSTRRLAFERVSEMEKRQMLGGLATIPYDDVEIVRAINFPAEQGQIRLQVSYDIGLSGEDCYCYWMANRPMYVTQINIDARNVDIDEVRMDLQPFVGFLGDVSYTRRQPKLFSIALNDWVLQGHGVAFVWGNNRHAQQTGAPG